MRKIVFLIYLVANGREKDGAPQRKQWENNLVENEANNSMSNDDVNCLQEQWKSYFGECCVDCMSLLLTHPHDGLTSSFDNTLFNEDDNRDL